jgi:hypothetical protein
MYTGNISSGIIEGHYKHYISIVINKNPVIVNCGNGEVNLFVENAKLGFLLVVLIILSLTKHWIIF